MKKEIVPSEVKMEFHKVSCFVPQGTTLEHFRAMTEVLFSLTPADSDDEKAARWAIMKAAILLRSLKNEAMRRL